MSVAQAVEVVASWLEQPCANIVDRAERHFDVLRRLLEFVGTAGNLTSDAHLAALALEFGVESRFAAGDGGKIRGLDGAYQRAWTWSRRWRS